MKRGSNVAMVAFTAVCARRSAGRRNAFDTPTYKGRMLVKFGVLS